MSFTTRLQAGEQHEHRVRRELESRGWEVTPWGQGMLPEQTRRMLRDSGSRFRHFPDLIAARSGEIALVDAKDRMRSTESVRYAVARDCVSFGLQFLGAFNLSIYYVFGNLGVLCPTEVMSYGRVGPRATGAGAYYLISERLAHHFDDVFGTPEYGSAAALCAPRPAMARGPATA